MSTPATPVTEPVRRSSGTGTEIAAEPDSREILITRTFQAPPERVFAAFADPELFARWVGPEGTDTRVEHWDARTGGSWRYVSLLRGEEFGFHGCFHEVDAPRTMTQTFEFEGYPGHVALERADFEEVEGGRTRLVQRSVFQSVQDRDGMLESGMETGVFEGFDALESLLAEPR